AGSFQLLLDVVGFSLGDAFLDGLRSGFNQRLGFAQAETGNGADFLDDVDLVLTEGGEDHVEFGLFFSSVGRGGATGSSGNGDRSSGGNAPLLFQELAQFGSFQNGQGRKVVYEFGEISSHFVLFSVWVRMLR